MEFRKTESTPSSKKEELQGVEVQLPSRGVDYSWTSDGKILIRPMKVREAKFVAQMSPQTYQENLSRVLPHVILKPGGIDPWSLTPGDRSYLFLWLRIQIIPDYHFSYSCPTPKCDQAFNKYDLREVPIVTLSEKYEGPMELTLLKSGHQVVLRLDRASDEREIQQRVEKDELDEWVATYTQTLSKINGKDVEFSKRYQWVEDLDPADFGFIRQFFVWAYHGPDFTSCPVKCEKCGGEGVIMLPFRAEYYLPSISFRGPLRDAVHDSFVSRRGSGSLQGPGGAGDERVPVSEKEG